MWEAMGNLLGELLGELVARHPQRLAGHRGWGLLQGLVLQRMRPPHPKS